MLALFAVLIIAVMFFRDWRSSRLDLFDYMVVRVSLIYSRFWHRLGSNRAAPFRNDRGCLIVSNHTCSTDPMYILARCDFPVGFGVAHEHFRITPFFGWVLEGICSVPIQRGGHDATALRRILRTIERGRNICLFIEGNLSSVARNKCGHPKHGAAYVALKTRAPVYPVFIHGGPRTDDLLACWVLPTPKSARVIFGPPIDLSAYYDRPLTRKLIAEVSQIFIDRIYGLKPERARGA